MRHEKPHPGFESRLTLTPPVKVLRLARGARPGAVALAWLCLGLIAGLAPKLAAQKPVASVIGVVTGARGRPEPGAVILLRPLLRRNGVWRRITGPGGAFLISMLPAGFYWLQAGKGNKLSAPQRLQIREGETVLLNLKLAPAARGKIIKGLRAYRWVLRADAVHRPILRFRGQDSGQPRWTPLNGSVSMLAGSGGTAFSMPAAVNTSIQMHTLADDMLLGFSGSMGTSGWNASSSFTASLTPQLQGWYRGSWRATVQHIPAPVLGHLPELDLFTLNYSNQANLGRSLRLQYGLMTSALNGVNTLRQISPYARLNWQWGAGRHLEYRYAAAPPPLVFEPNGLESPNLAPRISVNGGQPVIERGVHQELAFFSSLDAANEIELAWFYDRFHHAIINGAWNGALPVDLLNSGNILPDLYSNLFSADGGNYAGSGALALLQHQLEPGLNLSVGAETGPVLAARGGRLLALNPESLLTQTQAASMFARLSGELGPTHTRIICSYRTAGARQLTSPDPYETEDTGQPYANLQISQPLPRLPFAQGRMVALVEVQNLLAQGYVPVYTPDGRIIYLIQAARALRGGLSFNF